MLLLFEMELLIANTMWMTKTIELIVLKTEFMAVPSSLEQPGNPEDTISFYFLLLFSNRYGVDNVLAPLA